LREGGELVSWARIEPACGGGGEEKRAKGLSAKAPASVRGSELYASDEREGRVL